MQKIMIINTLNEIFKNVFSDENIELTNETSAQDISEWDSLAHIRLVVTIEKEFKIQFYTAEVAELENIGEMIDLIYKKIT
jgi:acyl carrier protein